MEKYLLGGFTVLFFLISLLSSQVFAANATIAVASNFTKTIESINEAFKEQYPEHKIRFSFGPTGKLFAQIKNGAPFHAFFAADERRAQLAIREAQAVKGSYFVYAQGKIVLYSEQFPVSEQPIEVLQKAEFNYIALANPKTAPYGERAQAFLVKKGLYKALKSKVVNGESIAHAFQYVATGNAPIGFIALSQVVDPQSPIFNKGQYWQVPQTDYQPINQGAVVTEKGAGNLAVQDFMKFMQSSKAVEIIQRYGYGVN